MSMILSRLVLYWKGAGNVLKIFTYLTESAANCLNMGLAEHALEYLEEIDKIMANNQNRDELYLSSEDKCKLNSLKVGQFIV